MLDKQWILYICSFNTQPKKVDKEYPECYPIRFFCELVPFLVVELSFRF